MNPERRLRTLVFLALWLLAPSLYAQSAFPPANNAPLDTPAQAAKALEEAGTLQARMEMLRPVADTFLKTQEYETLLTTVSALSVPEGAAWQRTFLLADLHALLGDTDEAARLLGQLPKASLRDPFILKYRIAHPDLFGDSPIQPPPGLDAGPPDELLTNSLDTMEPDKAWAVIAAHSDAFLDDLETWHKRTAQFADQNLVPRLLPLLAARVERQPDNWEMRLTLAQFQLLNDDPAGATASFRQVYAWKPDGSTPAPTPAERVAAMQGITLWSLRHPSGGAPFGRLKTVENARDLALICLAGLADERREGARFIHALEGEYRDDETGWITALMLIDSPGLVLRELHTCLAKGPPPGINTLAGPWLRTNHLGKMGADWSQQERARLAVAFARLDPDASPGAPGSFPGSENFALWRKELARLEETSKNPDPAAKEKFLAELAASTDPRSPGMLLNASMHHAAQQPEDNFFLRVAAILLAKATDTVEGRIADHAFDRPTPWFPPRQWPGRNDMGPFQRDLRSTPTAQPPTTNEQVEAVFLAQSPPSWSPLNFAPRSDAQRTPVPPTLAPALEKLAGDKSSPFRIPARIAEAYILHDVAGQEDHALDLLRQTIKESPSYVARFWLTAFLARRQQYKEADTILADIKPVPGYFENFLQGGRTLLQRADKGEPLFQRESPTAQNLSPTTKKRPSTTTDLLTDLQRLTDPQTGSDPSAREKALAIAMKLSVIFPAEATFPSRQIVLKTFAKFGRLDEQIAQIEERAKAFPKSADAQLALGDAWALSTQPQAPSTATTAYRKAFQLAPDRVDIASKITGSDFSIREQQDAFCVLLHQNSTSGRSAISSLFHEPDELVRYTKAYGEGFGRWGRKGIAGNFYFRDWIASLRKAGLDEAVIDMLTVISQSAPMESEYYSEPEKILLGLLEEKGRTTEVAPVVDRMLFPSEYLYGLDLGDGVPMGLLNPPDALGFIQKVKTPERMTAFEDHARQIMRDHPGGTRTPLVLLTLLIMDHAHTLRAELPVCLAALPPDTEDRLGDDLSSLARMASTDPDTQSAALDLLAEVRRRRAGKPSELATIELLATTALDMGDHARAEGALRELLETARAQKKSPNLQEWTANLGLMAQAGMEPEAAELSALVYGQAKGNPQNDRRTTCAYVLDYIEACLRYGQPEMGRKALTDFQRLLVTDVTDLGDPEQIRYKFDEKFLRQMVEIFISLDRADEAAKALRTLQDSRMAAAAPELRARIETAQKLLTQATGGPGALPVAFVQAANDRELTLWWNVSALAARSDSWARTEVSVFGADLKSLSGRYSVEILGGDTPNHLTRLAAISHALGRGEWHGVPETNPALIRFTRVILTDADGAKVIGPAVPITPGDERLSDPGMSEIIKTGTSSASWTLPEGVLSATTGPIPSHSALAFVYKGSQPSCEFRGVRIPVHKGESFVQSAWLRSAEGCRWGVLCLDAQGKELTDLAGMALSAPYESPGWTLVEQRLERTNETSGNKRVRTGKTLPSGTAFIEPVLTLSSNVITWDARAPVSWAGLSLRSVPPVEDKPQTPASAPEELRPVETSTPALTADAASTARNETIFAEFTSPARVVAVSPESDMVVAGCQDGTVHFLEYPSGKELAAVHAHDDPIMDISVLPAKAGAYSVDTRGDTHLVSFNPVKDDLVAWTAHPPSQTALSPTRKWIIFASDERQDDHPQEKTRIEVVDLTNGKQVRLFEEAGLFFGMSLSPDEKQISIVTMAMRRSWELPSFNQLPDGTDNKGWQSTGGISRHPLFVADPLRNRYVMVERTGRFVVRTMDSDILWTFNPAPGAQSLAMMPKDGAIFLCKEGGGIWRCVSPK